MTPNSVLLAVAALVLTACSGPAPAPKSATSAAPTATVPAPTDFVIDDLKEEDGNIQGCTTMLARVRTTAPGNVFIEDGVDTGAVGFIRIDTKLVKLTLVSATPTDRGAVRTFADPAKTVRVVETTTTGQSREESDSVDQSGTIAVTHKGATQTIAVEGGTAC